MTDKNWARRHRLQHAAHLRGETVKQLPQVTRRLSSEFEAALRARGAAAKEAARAKR